ncbi:MAG: hypothetical protein QM820_46715 [Minicystis sp.]
MNRPFPAAQIETMWEHLNSRDHENDSAVLSVGAHGGRVNAVDPAATAMAHRSSILLLQYLVFWDDPSHDAVNLRWIRQFYDAMYGPRGPIPEGTVDGCFVNYADADSRGVADPLLQGQLSSPPGRESALGPGERLPAPAIRPAGSVAAGRARPESWVITARIAGILAA